MGGTGTSLVKSIDSGRLLVLGVTVLVVEASLRTLLAWQVDPRLVVVWPPVLAVLTFGLGNAAARGRRFGSPPVAGILQWTGLFVIHLTVAVVGHLFAIVLGGALFVLAEVPFRLAWETVGLELVQWPFVPLVVGLVGFGLGTAIAWAVPEVFLAEVGGGTPLRTASASLLFNPRLLCRVALLNALFVVSVGASVAVGDLIIEVTAPPNEGQVWPLVVVTFSTLSVLALLPLTASLRGAMSGINRRARADRASPSSGGGSTVLRLLVAVALVSTLVGTAGALRAEEIQSEELPEIDGVVIEPQEDLRPQVSDNRPPQTTESVSMQETKGYC